MVQVVAPMRSLRASSRFHASTNAAKLSARLPHRQRQQGNPRQELAPNKAASALPLACPCRTYSTCDFTSAQGSAHTPLAMTNDDHNPCDAQCHQIIHNAPHIWHIADRERQLFGEQPHKARNAVPCPAAKTTALRMFRVRHGRFSPILL